MCWTGTIGRNKIKELNRGSTYITVITYVVEQNLTIELNFLILYNRFFKQGPGSLREFCAFICQTLIWNRFHYSKRSHPKPIRSCSKTKTTVSELHWWALLKLQIYGLCTPLMGSIETSKIWYLNSTEGLHRNLKNTGGIPLLGFIET